MGRGHTAVLVQCDQHLCEDFSPPPRDLGISKFSWVIGEGFQGNGVGTSSGDPMATMGRCTSYLLRSPKYCEVRNQVFHGMGGNWEC